MRGEGRQPKTAGMETTSSTNNSNDFGSNSKDETTFFNHDEEQKKQESPRMHQNNSPAVAQSSCSFAQVDSPQFSNISSTQFSSDSFRFSSRIPSAISNSLNSCKDIGEGVDWDQEVERVFMEEIDKMSKQME